MALEITLQNIFTITRAAPPFAPNLDLLYCYVDLIIFHVCLKTAIKLLVDLKMANQISAYHVVRIPICRACTFMKLFSLSN